MRKYFTLIVFILLSLNSFSQSNNKIIEQEQSGLGSVHGSGNGVNGRLVSEPYSLTGRKAISKPNPDINCNEYGTVAMQIVVDRKGNVLEATPGRGTTNLSQCLVKASKEAALKTKWNADKNASEKQVGRIVYKFKMK